MRNFSMKKFGTPIAAGPGWASEKLGLSTVGAPSGVRALAVRSSRWAPRSSTRLAPSRVFACCLGCVVVVGCLPPFSPLGWGAWVGSWGEVGCEGCEGCEGCSCWGGVSGVEGTWTGAGIS